MSDHYDLDTQPTATSDNEIRAIAAGKVAGNLGLCVRCVVALQLGDDGQYVGDYAAITVSKGDALCLQHFNTTRGWPRRYDRDDASRQTGLFEDA